ncbi:hypothetical protein [Epibacterium ulvae]|uniref:hypothetical protein n=1 Tax=Epibacterium ulvae TaxID=1156985 RepID=UPI00248F89B3|nr:hypothetical protein [Epibacterium ulvae]
MKKLALTIALLLGTPALAEDISIATGKLGGGYDAAANSLQQRLEQRGFDVEIDNYAGSDEITLALCSGDANLGIAQIDAVDARASEGCNLKPVGVYGEEIAVILFPPKSRLDELDDITADHAVLVDTIGSGTDLFWHTIVRIETGDDGNKSAWSKVRPVNEPVDLAETLASFGEIDAVMMVRTPKSPDIENLLKRGWTLGELHDKDLDDYKFGDASLYEGRKITLKGSYRKQKGYGYTVRSFYLVTSDLAADRKAFSTIAGAAR